MNNSAFSQLVRERIQVKSSKEIARDAVQAEFQNKHKGLGKKRRRGAGYNEGYSSDEDDNKGDRNKKGRDDDNEKRPKPLFSMKPPKKSEESSDATTSQYRDRAKERREGKVTMEGGTATSKESIYEELLDKELDAAADAADSKATRADPSNQQAPSEEPPPRYCETAQEAREWIQNLSIPPQSSLPLVSTMGRDMVDFLKLAYLPSTQIPSQENDTVQKKKVDLSGLMDTIHQSKDNTVSTAGLTIQQSVLTFTTVARPGDGVRAWEIPKEQTFGNSNLHQFDRASTCPPELLERMQVALDRKWALVPDDSDKKSRAKPGAGPTETSRGVGETAIDGQEDDDDDDDDIFGDVGDYDPLASTHQEDQDEKAPSKLIGDSTQTKKISFFGEDDTKTGKKATASSDEEGEVDPLVNQRKQDPLAQSTMQRLQGFAAPGVGASSYGEEMDVDFDGRFENDDHEGGEKASKKKKKKKKGNDDEDD